jgi:tetratricopeptide (TPR) repeat protein
MTQEMQALEQQDALLAQLGEYYAATGNRAEAVATRFKRLELRTVHQALQGAQAVARMEMGDFSMAASAVSNATGASVQIQPRADGKFNLLVNGQVFDEGLTYAELKDYVRSTTDSAYRTQQAAIAEAMFKADIEQSGKNADSERKIVEKAAELFQTGQNAEALEKLKQAGLSVQLTDFGIFLFSQDGNNVFTIDPAGKLSPVGVPQPVVGPTSTPVPLR